MRHAKLTLGGILFCALALSGGIRAGAQPPPPVEDSTADKLRAAFGEASGLTVVEAAGLERLQTSHGRVNFGTVDVLATPHLQRKFVLKNEGKEPVTIQYIRTSCGCERVAMRKDGKVEPQVTLASGETVEVEIVVNITRQRAGIKNVHAWAQGKGVEKPLAEMEILANIQPVVVYEPQMLSFGRIEAGKAHTQTLKVTLDKRLAGTLEKAPLGSYSPYVEVVPGEKPEETGELAGKPAIVRNYKVTIKPNAPVRLLAAGLAFRPAGESSAPGINIAGGNRTPPVSARAVAPDPSKPETLYTLLPPVMVTGDVMGPISALPGNVFFGIVPEGTEMKRLVRLTGKELKLIQDVQVTSSHPAITVKLGAVETPAGDKVFPFRQMEIILSGTAPIGPVNAKLTVRTPTGEELIMSVVAQVQKKQP